MTLGVEFRKRASEDLEGLDSVIAQRILDKIKWLSENFDSITPQPLKRNLKGKYKLRIGDWRVIYAVDKKGGLITIHLVGHRKDIYD